VALVVVAAVRAVGVLLVIAFLVVPAAAARLLTARLWAVAAVGCAMALASSVVGLLASYHASVGYGLRLAAGPTVVLTMSLVYVGCVVGASARRLIRARTGRRQAELAAGRPMAGALR
jgi:manganese/iron transport system permease protein